jgi:branched-chain amino acid aminotransferase
MPTFQLQKSSAFLRDKFVPFNEANVSIASSPVLYGLTIYTVFNCRWNNQQEKLYIFKLHEHYQRLANSARIMDFDGFTKQWPYERFESTIVELLRRNHVKEDVLVRVAVFIDELAAGTKIHGLTNSLSAYIYPIGEILPRSGAHVCVSSWTRTQDNAIPSRAKVNGSYINASLMKNEALLNGYDDAISIDHNGHVAEGTVANLFIVRGNVLITPAAATDVLEGITRSSILTLAEDIGVKTEERSIDRSELYIADEVFFCGSSAQVTPVLSIDKRPVGSGQIGLITKKIMREYNKLQSSGNPKYSHWLTAV